MSNQVNQATVLGINAVNKSRQADVESKAQNLIGQILGNQKTIKSYDALVTEEKVKLNELALDVIDQRTVVGSEFGTPLNPNQVTILNAIKKLNDARQESVSIVSQGHINKIKGYEATIKNLNTQVDGWRKQLAELAAEVVTPEQVVGQ